MLVLISWRPNFGFLMPLFDFHSCVSHGVCYSFLGFRLKTLNVLSSALSEVDDAPQPEPQAPGRGQGRADVVFEVAKVKIYDHRSDLCGKRVTLKVMR
jgi:hypothetical protein